MKGKVFLALMIVALLATLAYCQGGPGGPGPGGPGGPPPPPPKGIHPPPPADMIDALTAQLTLSADQATALKALLTKADATIQPLRQAAGDAEKALHEAFRSGDLDKAAELAQAASDADLSLTKASIDAWKQIKDSGVLTDDQFTKLLEGPGPCHGGPPPAEASSGTPSGSASAATSATTQRSGGTRNRGGRGHK